MDEMKQRAKMERAKLAHIIIVTAIHQWHRQ